METNSTSCRAETLVALDWKSEGLPIASILDFVGEHLLSHEVTTTAHFRTGEPIITHRVTFNARQVRNSHVSGKAYHAGFVSHIE